MSVLKREIKISHIPAIIWGRDSRRLYLYIHGQGGNKEEANQIAETACKHGYQILSVDLPEHGSRKGGTSSFDPWHILPELKTVMDFAKGRWEEISLFAVSIGCWFSMLGFQGEYLKNSLFVSPVLDMKQLTLKMMDWTNVSEARLKQEFIIETSFGQTLSWEYWQYVLEHPIEKWGIPTKILYGENDNLIDYGTVEQFSCQYNCNVTVMEDGEHWFRTEQQLEFMCNWFRGILL